MSVLTAPPDTRAPETRPVEQEPCRHDHIEQYSTIQARTDWSRNADGHYEPDEVPLTKVMSEDTWEWKCKGCGETIDEPDDDEIA